HMNVFCFQAEDGIRDRNVTGVQTCALPILGLYTQYAMDMDQIIVVPGNHDINFRVKKGNQEIAYADLAAKRNYMDLYEELYKIKIGRASCRERVYNSEGVGSLKK